MSLRFKFIIVFLVFSVVLSGVFAVITTQHLSTQLKDQEKRFALHYITHAAEEILGSLLFRPEQDFVLQEKNLMIESVLFIQIVIDNQVKTETSIDHIALGILPLPQSTTLKQVDSSIHGPYMDIVEPLDIVLEELVMFRYPASENGEEIINTGIQGYIRLGWSLQRVNQRVFNESLMLTGLSLAFILVGLMLGRVLYRAILGPLETLSATMREFGAGNTYVRAHIASGDEIEMLGHEFDTMAHAIVEQRNALRQTNEQLAKANEVKSTFLATVSHELRTPLHSILGYISLLLDGVNVKLNEAGLQYAHAIQRGGKHLLSLIENMIEFSKLESGTEQLHVTTVEIEDVVDEVLEGERPLWEKKSLNVSKQVEPQLVVCADRTKLKQVLLNLIHNAIKYTQQGEIHISARRANSSVRIEVADTGPGIAPEIQSSLFDPFVRAGAPNKGEGMGLGLAVVKRYIERMHGTLDFESAPGQGSRFWLTLPLKGFDETADR